MAKWKLTYMYGCWVAENEWCQQIWSKDEKTIRDMFEKAGYSLKEDNDEEMSHD